MKTRQQHKTLFTGMVMAAALFSILPHGQGATYDWTGSASGAWDPGLPENWNGVSPTFDNQADVIFFKTGAANFNPTFLGNSDRTLRTLSFNANVSSSLALNLDDNAGAARVLGFSSDTGTASILVEAGASGAITLGGSGLGGISLSSDLNITNDSATAVLSLKRPIVEGVLGRGLRKYGPGKLVLESDGTSDWSGTTIIRGGTVELGANESISDFSTVTVAAGTLDLKGRSETIYTSITLGEATTTVAGSTAAITDSAGGGVLNLSGTAVAVNYVAGSAGFNNGTATIGASLDLKGVSHNFSVANSTNTPTDLVVSGPITGTGSIQKLGQGTMVLAAVNTYTNTVDFYTTLGDGITKLGVDQAIPGMSIVALNWGTLDINGKAQDLLKAPIRLGAGTTTVGGRLTWVVDSAGGGLFRSMGVQYNAGSAAFPNGQATISANLDLNGAYRFFTIADSTNAAIDTLITGCITNSSTNAPAGPVKGGAGVLVLAGTNTYNGNLAIRQGTVRFASSGAHPLVGVGVSCLNGTTATLDLAGYPATATFLTLGFDNPSAVNSKNTIVDSATGGLLTLFGGVTYTNGVAGKNNGQATISANLDLGGTNRFFAISDSDQTSTEVVISGRIGNAAHNGAGLTKTGPGALSLSGSNTYDGTTVVQEGALLLAGGGSVASSTNLSVSPGALLDVAGVSGGFVLGSAQTLTGGGNIKGPVLANGTVAPEAWGAPAVLNFTNNLQFGATGLASLRVGKAGGQLASGLVRVVSGNLTFGGALQVQLLNATEPLAVGDTFTLFSASGTIGGAFSSISLPAGYGWDTNLLASGRLAVTSVSPTIPTTPTNISFSISAGMITISWPDDYIGWSLQAQTNTGTVGLGTNWTTIEGSAAVSTMSFQVDTNNSSVFYRLFYKP